LLWLLHANAEMTAVLCNNRPPAPTTRSDRCLQVAAHGRRRCQRLRRVRRFRTGIAKTVTSPIIVQIPVTIRH